MACRLDGAKALSDILPIGPLGTHLNEISFEIKKFSCKKMHLKIPSGKWQPFCLSLNVYHSVILNYFIMNSNESPNCLWKFCKATISRIVLSIKINKFIELIFILLPIIKLQLKYGSLLITISLLRSHKISYNIETIFKLSYAFRHHKDLDRYDLRWQNMISPSNWPF